MTFCLIFCLVFCLVFSLLWTEWSYWRFFDILPPFTGRFA